MPTELVVKVGGSLYSLPNLGRYLRTWLGTQLPRRVLIIPGGGPAADMVRHVDALDQLGEQRCHWLALRALTLTAHVLAARLPGGCVIDNLDDRQKAWRRDQMTILDMHAFALADEARPDHLPHLWAVTSDSLAARVAIVAGIPELVLLKSCDMPADCDWQEAARRGFVDTAFPEVLAKANPKLRVTTLNFRRWLAADTSAAPEQDLPP
ncbi:MAG TPA: hypothetical protein VE988_02880 [Gemmataceae bacterium]|nr:hypothetical protein [Gemmataceae bacterium]